MSGTIDQMVKIALSFIHPHYFFVLTFINANGFLLQACPKIKKKSSCLTKLTEGSSLKVRSVATIFNSSQKYGAFYAVIMIQK